jgi:hypothetical protein
MPAVPPCAVNPSTVLSGFWKTRGDLRLSIWDPTPPVLWPRTAQDYNRVAEPVSLRNRWAVLVSLFKYRQFPSYNDFSTL